MQSVAVGMLVVLDHREHTDERNEENIEEVTKSFISMKGDLRVIKKIRKKVAIKYL